MIICFCAMFAYLCYLQDIRTTGRIVSAHYEDGYNIRFNGYFTYVEITDRKKYQAHIDLLVMTPSDSEIISLQETI